MALLRDENELLESMNETVVYAKLNELYCEGSSGRNINMSRIELTPEGVIYHGSLAVRKESRDDANCPKTLSIPGIKLLMIDGHFYCSFCDHLTTLEGAPDYVCGSFYCDCCDNLTTLEGAPHTVGSQFICSACRNLKSLKYISEYVGKRVICSQCPKLRTIDYRPKNNPVFVFNN